MKKTTVQTILIVILALAICFAGTGCSKVTLCQHIQKNMVGYK